MQKTVFQLINSLRQTSLAEEINEILGWIEEKNKSLKVSITKNRLSESGSLSLIHI